MIRWCRQRLHERARPRHPACTALSASRTTRRSRAFVASGPLLRSPTAPTSAQAYHRLALPRAGEVRIMKSGCRSWFPIWKQLRDVAHAAERVPRFPLDLLPRTTWCTRAERQPTTIPPTILLCRRPWSPSHVRRVRVGHLVSQPLPSIPAVTAQEPRHARRALVGRLFRRPRLGLDRDRVPHTGSLSRTDTRFLCSTGSHLHSAALCGRSRSASRVSSTAKPLPGRGRALP